jgi:hypothetical protein
MYRKHSDRLLRTVLVTAISLSLLWIFSARKPLAGRAAAIGLLLKTGSQLVCFSFSSDHIARSDSTQLISTGSENIQNFTIEQNWRFFSWVELNRIGRVITSNRAMWSLYRSDSSHLSSTELASWVELSRIGQNDHRFKTPGNAFQALHSEL